MTLRWIGILDECERWVDESWDWRDQIAVVNYTTHGQPWRDWMSGRTCKVCGEVTTEYDFSDDTYAWPGALAHYVWEHHVRLPDEFVAHARQRLKEVHAQPADDTWWLAQTPPDRIPYDESAK